MPPADDHRLVIDPQPLEPIADPPRPIGQDQQPPRAAMDAQHRQQRPDLVDQFLRRVRGQMPAAAGDQDHRRQGQDLLACGVGLGMDLHLVEFDQHDVRVHPPGVVPLDLGELRGTCGEPDQRRGGRLRRQVLAVVAIAGLGLRFGRGDRRDQHPQGLGLAVVDGRGAGVGRGLQLLPLVVDDLQDGRLGQHGLFAGPRVDPDDGLLGRIAEHPVAGRVTQPRRDGDLSRGLPGVGGGDLGRAVGVVLDASAADVDRAEDGLEGVGGGAAAGDPPAVFAVPSRQDQFGVGLLDGLLEQPAFEDLAAAFDAGFEASGQLGILLGQGQFQGELGLQDQAVVLDLDLAAATVAWIGRGACMGRSSVGAVVWPCVLFYLSPLKSSSSAHRLPTGRKKVGGPDAGPCGASAEVGALAETELTVEKAIALVDYHEGRNRVAKISHDKAWHARHEGLKYLLL